MRARIVALSLLSVLAACDRIPAPEDAGMKAERPLAADFVSVIDGDVSGYYVPVSDAADEGWVFHHLFLGQKPEFEAWQAGRRSATFAPVMIEFEDRSSPMTQTELGETHSGRDRVLPTTYRVTNRRVEFEGRTASGQAVVFSGALDPDELAQSRRNLGAEGAVLTGTLTVGGRSQRLNLRWWAGD